MAHSRSIKKPRAAPPPPRARARACALDRSGVHGAAGHRAAHVAAIGLYMATLASPWPPVAPSTPTLLVRGGSLPVSTA
jgi:hypothetical protein